MALYKVELQKPREAMLSSMRFWTVIFAVKLSRLANWRYTFRKQSTDSGQNAEKETHSDEKVVNDRTGLPTQRSVGSGDLQELSNHRCDRDIGG